MTCRWKSRNAVNESNSHGTAPVTKGEWKYNNCIICGNFIGADGNGHKPTCGKATPQDKGEMQQPKAIPTTLLSITADQIQIQKNARVVAPLVGVNGANRISDDYYLLDYNGQFVRVNGEPVQLPPPLDGLDVFITKETRDMWSVVDGTTGMRMASGETQKETLKKLAAQLNHVGSVERLKSLITDLPGSPRYEKYNPPSAIEKAIWNSPSYDDLTEEQKQALDDLLKSDKMMSPDFLNTYYNRYALAEDLIDYIKNLVPGRPIPGSVEFENSIRPVPVKRNDDDDEEFIMVGCMKLDKYMPGVNVEIAQEALRQGELKAEYPDGTLVFVKRQTAPSDTKYDTVYVYNPDKLIMEVYTQQWNAARAIARRNKLPPPPPPAGTPTIDNAEGLGSGHKSWREYLDDVCSLSAEIDGYKLYNASNSWYIVEPDGVVTTRHGYHGQNVFREMIGKERAEQLGI